MVAAVDMVVGLEAAVPAVEGSGQRGAFDLNVHPVAAGTGRHIVKNHIWYYNVKCTICILAYNLVCCFT